MNICIRIITTIFILLIASNAFAGLQGYWKLHINVTTPAMCTYEDPLLMITQSGASSSGTAHLSRIGISGCPSDLTGTITLGIVDPPPPLTTFSFPWDGPMGIGTITLTGQFTDGKSAAGTFSSALPGGGSIGFVSGTWSLNGITPPASVPTSTEWGRIILILLVGLGAVYYLRKRRMALS